MLKQTEAQEKLKKELDMVQQQDKSALQREQEREQIRKEVEAQFQAQAANFVQEQIQQAQQQLQMQFDAELQARINDLSISGQIIHVPQVEMKDESQSQVHIQTNQDQQEGHDTVMVSASRIRQRNQSNMIRNRSINSSVDQ